MPEGSKTTGGGRPVREAAIVAVAEQPGIELAQLANQIRQAAGVPIAAAITAVRALERSNTLTADGPGFYLAEGVEPPARPSTEAETPAAAPEGPAEARPESESEPEAATPEPEPVAAPPTPEPESATPESEPAPATPTTPAPTPSAAAEPASGSLAERISAGDSNALAQYRRAREAAVHAYCSRICEIELISTAVEAAFAGFALDVAGCGLPAADLDQALLARTYAESSPRAIRPAVRRGGLLQNRQLRAIIGDSGSSQSADALASRFEDAEAMFFQRAAEAPIGGEPPSGWPELESEAAAPEPEPEEGPEPEPVSESEPQSESEPEPEPESEPELQPEPQPEPEARRDTVVIPAPRVFADDQPDATQQFAAEYEAEAATARSRADRQPPRRPRQSRSAGPGLLATPSRAVVAGLLVAALVIGVGVLLVNGDRELPPLTPTEPASTLPADRPASPRKNRKEPIFDTGQVTVTVLNGSGIEDLGEETAKRLKKEGFKIDDVEDAAEQVDVTRVLFDKKEDGSRRFALAVKRNLLPTRSVIIEPFDEISDGLAGEGEIVVIVGPDLADDEF